MDTFSDLDQSPKIRKWINFILLRSGNQWIVFHLPDRPFLKIAQKMGTYLPPSKTWVPILGSNQDTFVT